MNLFHLFGQGKPAVKRSKDWPRYRKIWLTQHPTCAACGTTKSLEVHHMEPVSWNPARELDTTNFITLCELGDRNHHLWLGHLGDWKSKNINVIKDSAYLLNAVKTRPYPGKAVNA